MTYWFDMDGTIANLYSVENWLDKLIAEDPSPYAMAQPLINMSVLARAIHRVQKAGNQIGIISWCSKNCSLPFEQEIERVKCAWLYQHLPSVQWDFIKVVPYGTNKKACCGDGILFDDEQGNRDDWGDGAFTPDQILQILKDLGD